MRGIYSSDERGARKASVGDGSMCKSTEGRMVLKKKWAKRIVESYSRVLFYPSTVQGGPDSTIVRKPRSISRGIESKLEYLWTAGDFGENCWRRAPRNGQPYVKTSMESRLAEWSSLAAEVDSCLVSLGDACEWIVRSLVQQIDLLEPI